MESLMTNPVYRVDEGVWGDGGEEGLGGVGGHSTARGGTYTTTYQNRYASIVADPGVDIDWIRILPTPSPIKRQIRNLQENILIDIT